MADHAEALADRVREAMAHERPLAIAGSGSKADFTGAAHGETLDVTGHTGIVDYQPTELVITARGGTTVAELTQTLAARQQVLPFEPPQCSERSTIAGVVACGLSGPARPYAGPLRDFLLGVRIINGRGEVLNFGGQVMKNVAGYDISRLCAGAHGTLGILLQCSFKVLPSPASCVTRVLDMPPAAGIVTLQQLGRRPLPISGAAYADGRLHIRLSGEQSAVHAAVNHIGGEDFENADAFWSSLRDFHHPFFADRERPLWRLSVPAHTPALDLDGAWLWDCGGGVRWLQSDQDAEAVRQAAAAHSGHATWIRGGPPPASKFHPLPAAMFALHRHLKLAFDPLRILNRGRLYPDF